jgi:hypothetical protein
VGDGLSKANMRHRVDLIFVDFEPNVGNTEQRWRQTPGAKVEGKVIAALRLQATFALRERHAASFGSLV